MFKNPKTFSKFISRFKWNFKKKKEKKVNYLH